MKANSLNLYAVHLVFSSVGNRAFMLERILLLKATTMLAAEKRGRALGRLLAAERIEYSGSEGDEWRFEGVRKSNACEPILGGKADELDATSFTLEVANDDDVKRVLARDSVEAMFDW